MFFRAKSSASSAAAPPGRGEEMPLTDRHFVHGHSLKPPFPDGTECAAFALGCFWGAERIYWQLPGVHTTAVGYAGGQTPNATYAEICGGKTGHAEAVLVVYDPTKIAYADLLRAFWQAHDPTQGDRQGNDVGSQYRSAIYAYNDAQMDAAKQSKTAYQTRLTAAGYGEITTEIRPAPAFYYAEDAHQQYLAKNPGGYCGLGGTGVL